jgi:hypothetical protein
MGKKLGLFALLLLFPFAALADNPIAFRIGPGAQMTCSASAPTHISTRGTVWCNSSDGNRLYYTDPSAVSTVFGSTADSSRFLSTSYGVKCDGSTDDTSALQSTVTALENAKGGTLQLPTGTCVITGTITMHRGTFIKGGGTQGSTVGYGTVILHKANSTNLFVWDGNGTTSAAGTGGGMEDVFIAKAQTYSGGDAIYITSTDDNHRPGEMRFRNILVGAENNAALWSRAFHLDGSANTTAGTRGIRSIRFDKVRLNACNGTAFPNKCLHLTQVTHFFADHLEVDPVGGDGSIGMTIDGNYDDIFIPSMEINGTVVLDTPSDGAYLPNVFMRGRAGTALTVNATTIVGQADVIATAVTNSSNSFNVNNAGTSYVGRGTWTNTGLTTIKGTTAPAGSLFVVQDSAGNPSLTVTDNAAITIKPGAADSSGAVGVDINTISSWVTSGAKLIRARIQGGSDVFSVAYNGAVTARSATLIAGTGTQTGSAPITIYSDATVTPSVTSGETDGSSYTMPANTLSANGQMFKCQAAWTHAANTNATTFKLYVAGVAVISASNSTSGDTIGVEIRFVRTTSSLGTYHALITSGGALTSAKGVFNPLTWSNNNIIKISVTGATTNGDLSTNYLRCEWWPN